MNVNIYTSNKISNKNISVNKKIQINLTYSKNTGKYTSVDKNINYNDFHPLINLTEVSLCTAIKQISTNAVAFHPCEFEKPIYQKKYWSRSRIIPLDFDNNDSDPDLLNKILKRTADYGFDYSFCYHTMSSTKVKPKFRLVFILDDYINNIEIYKMVYSMFVKLYPETDTAVRPHMPIYGGYEIVDYQTERFFNVDNLKHEFLMSIGQKNLNRTINRFCNNFNTPTDVKSLFESNNFLGVFYRSEPKTPNIVINNTTTVGVSSSDLMTNRAKNARNAIFTSEMIEKLGKICPIFDDFLKKNYINRQDFKQIVGHILYIRGGEKMLNEYIDLYPDNKYNRKKIIEYYKKNNYSNTCKSCTRLDCKNKTYKSPFEKLKETKVFVENQEYITITEAAEQLKIDLETSINAKSGIHLIEAPTGTGKTHQTLANIKPGTIYCTTDHNKLREAINLFKNFNPDMEYFYPTAANYKLIDKHVKYRNMLSIVYSTGDSNLINSKLREILDNCRRDIDAPFLSEDENTLVYRIYSNLSKYFNDRHKLKSILDNKEKSNIVVFLTTQKLFYNDNYKNIDVIMDEDFFDVALVTGSTKFDDIDMSNKEINKIVNKIIKNPSKITKVNVNKEVVSDYIKKLYRSNPDKANSVYGLLQADYCIYDDFNKNITHIKNNSLPKFKKLIVLSATAKAEYIKKLSGRSVKEYKYKPVENVGKIKQLLDWGDMSRASIRKDTDKFNKLNALAKTNNIKLLTYKSKTDAESYHHNATGSNKLIGSDILIVGVAALPDNIYRLYSQVLYGTSENSEMSTNITVRYKNMSTVRRSFVDKDTNDLHNWMIGRDLEQLIGRARLTRNDTTVYVVNTFPVDQAEILKEEVFITDIKKTTNEGHERTVAQESINYNKRKKESFEMPKSSNFINITKKDGHDG